MITFELIIFDCDGVLIDVRNSYDLAIKKTVQYIVKKIINVDIYNFVSNKLINKFKSSGGFNNEVDLAYSIILSIIASIKLNRSYEKFVFEVAANLDVSGINSVEKYISNITNIKDIISKLSYLDDDNKL